MLWLLPQKPVTLLFPLYYTKKGRGGGKEQLADKLDCLAVTIPTLTQLRTLMGQTPKT